MQEQLLLVDNPAKILKWFKLKNNKRKGRKMKNNKLKLFTIMLLIILVIMVGFFGVYSKNKGEMQNEVKDYAYTMELSGAQVARIKLSSSTKEVIKDKESLSFFLLMC